MSVLANSAWPPAALISLLTCWPASLLRSAMSTAAPSRARSRAVAAPIPDAPPVTTATLPVNLMTVLPVLMCRPAGDVAGPASPVLHGYGSAAGLRLTYRVVLDDGGHGRWSG